MRWLPLLFLGLLILVGVTYFFVTTSFLRREIVSSLPEQSIIEGPDLIAGYVLKRGFQGPESFIENAAGKRVMPPRDVDPSAVGVLRLAITGQFIIGEIGNLESGDSIGFFVIDTATGDVSEPRPEAAWRDDVRTILDAEPPPLIDADFFPEVSPAP